MTKAIATQVSGWVNIRLSLQRSIDGAADGFAVGQHAGEALHDRAGGIRGDAAYIAHRGLPRRRDPRFGVEVVDGDEVRGPAPASVPFDHPVIAAGALGLIREGHNGLLFDIQRPDTLHCAIEQTLNNPGTAKEMAARGREQVERDYGISALGKRLKKVYEELIEERSCAT